MARDNAQTYRRIAMILLIIALLPGSCMLGAGYYAQQRSQWLDSAAQVEGEVVENVRTLEDGTTYYAPVIAYETPDGRTRRHHSATRSDPPQFAVGDEVTVYYDRQDPTDVVLDTWFSKWGAAVVFGTLAAIPTLSLLVLAAIAYWASSAAQRRASQGGS